MPKLGDLGEKVEVLRQMRERLVEGQRRRHIEDERWGTFGEVSQKISEACSERNLENLVSAVRDMKNKLRRPAVRKELARIEGKDRDTDVGEKIPVKKDKNPTGACKCASCGKVIDGSHQPCIEDALCTDCALKSKVIPKEQQNKKKTVVPPPDMGMEGRENVETETLKDSWTLRRRGYLNNG